MIVEPEQTQSTNNVFELPFTQSVYTPSLDCLSIKETHKDTREYV